MCASMGDAEEFQKHVTFQELCFEPLRNAIPSELLSGCRQRHEQEDGNKEAVLEHIILDMTGSPVAAKEAGDAANQRTLRRTKRLLRRTNSVLFFRLVIMVLVACMLMVTTLLTWKFTRTYSVESMQNVSFLLRHQILQSSLNSISCVLTQTYTLSLALNAMHQHALLTKSKETWSTIEKQLQSINWGFLQSERQLSAVAFISQDGHATDFTREGNSDYLFFVNESTAGNKTEWYSQPVTSSPNGYVLQSQSKSSAAPYQDRFMTNVMALHDVVWSMESGGRQNHSFSTAVPVKDPLTEQYLGMSIVTTKQGNLHQYLSTIDLMGGYLYFFSRNASGVPSLTATSYDNPSDISVNPERASNPFVAEAARYLESKYGGLSLLQNGAHAENVILNGRKFYIDTLPLRNQFKFLNLTAVVIVPRTSIMGEMDARSRTVIKVCVCAAMGMLLIGFLLICFLTRNMSTEMQLRQELIRQLVAKHKAEQCSNYKSQFLANMSHEMRTPMAGIIGLLDLLACDTLTPDQEVSVAHIRRCARGLLTLVNNVLDISKVEAGKMELELAPFNIHDELESLVDMFSAQSLGSDVDFALDLSDEIPCVLMGDAACIRQVFSNLLSNSLKFTASGHILIRGWIDQSLLSVSRKSMQLSCHETADALKGPGSCRRRSANSESHSEEEKIVLVFEVDDTGCGIPTSMQETVFDSFVQVDSSTTRSHGGSGLGLYIVRSLVNMMGGDVQISPKSGPGTRIHFHLTIDRCKHPEKATRESSAGKARGSISQDYLSSLLGFPCKSLEEVKTPSPELLGRTHVLVALPETVTRSVTAHWLERRGIKVTGVNMWEDIIPTLHKLCKLSLADCNPFLSLGSQEMTRNPCIYTESPASPFALPSGGSSSCVSEITEWNRCPVLALIDVALMPCSLSQCPKTQKEGVACLKGAFITRLDTKKISTDLQIFRDALQKIQFKHDVLVAWVVTPNSGPCLTQALQSLSSSIVLKKPLHCSRMRRLLALLADVEKLDQPHSDVFSYTSSDPSTPPLADVRSSLKEANTTYNASKHEHSSLKTFAGELGRVCQDVAYAVEQDGILTDRDEGGKLFCAEGMLQPSKQEHVLSILPHIATAEKCCQSHLQERVFMKLSSHSGLGSEDSPSTPESPTSGLITPEGSYSMADGLQQVKKDSAACDRGFENEWEGPVIDLRTTVETTSKYVKSHYNDQTNVVMSASESPCTTEPPSPAGSHVLGGMGQGVLAGLHILIVEDTPVLQRLANMMLKKLGAEVTVVADGLQAVEAVAQAVKAREIGTAAAEETVLQPTTCRNIDLILMDCAMPVMDGYMATKTIREAEIDTDRHIPIVALTAHALASDEAKCLAVGMDAYLTKPINCKQLVSTVKKLVSGEIHHL